MHLHCIATTQLENSISILKLVIPQLFWDFSYFYSIFFVWVRVFHGPLNFGYRFFHLSIYMYKLYLSIPPTQLYFILFYIFFVIMLLFHLFEFFYHSTSVDVCRNIIFLPFFSTLIILWCWYIVDVFRWVFTLWWDFLECVW